MEDQSEVIMQAGIKMPLLLFQYFPEFIQEKKKEKKKGWEGKHSNTRVRI